MTAPAHRTVQSLVTVLMRVLSRRSNLERAAIEWFVPITIRNLERILTELLTPELFAQIDRETLYAYFAHRDVIVLALELLEEALAEDDLGSQLPAIREYLQGSGTEELADWALRFVALFRAHAGAVAQSATPEEMVAELGHLDLEGFLRHPASAVIRIHFLTVALVEAVARRAPVERAAELAVHAFLAADKVRVVFGAMGVDLNPDQTLRPSERGARALGLAAALARSLGPDDMASLTDARLGQWSSR